MLPALLLCLMVLMPAIEIEESESDKTAIATILKVWEEGVAEKDRTRLESIWLFPEALNLRIPDGGIAPGFPEDADAARYIDFTVKAEGKRTLSFSDVEIDVYGDLARIHAIWHYAIEGREVARGDDVMSLVRTSSGWKIVSVIWNRQRVE